MLGLVMFVFMGWMVFMVPMMLTFWWLRLVIIVVISTKEMSLGCTEEECDD